MRFQALCRCETSYSDFSTFETACILLDGVLLTVFIGILTFCLPSLINSISTGGGVTDLGFLAF